ncbi:MAG: hypothetical protein INR62_03170 [Rhodospirillales bacterium]|nr:hypothetical protein [Acetobacter sp.]
MSLASHLRAVALGGQVHSVLDHAAVSEWVRVAGNQGRLGGLLKLWLVEKPSQGTPEIEVHRLLDRLGDRAGPGSNPSSQPLRGG